MIVIVEDQLGGIGEQLLATLLIRNCRKNREPNKDAQKLKQLE
jgi:hypothetical protein